MSLSSQRTPERGPWRGWAGVLRKGPSECPWPTASLFLLHPRPGFLGGLPSRGWAFVLGLPAEPQVGVVSGYRTESETCCWAD